MIVNYDSRVVQTTNSLILESNSRIVNRAFLRLATGLGIEGVES